MTTRVSRRAVLLVGLVLSLLLAAVVSFYASPSPDGLEYVAERVGFLDTVDEHAAAGSPLADYGAAGIEDERLSTAVAGLAGVTVTGVLATGVALLVRRRTGDEPSGD